MRSRLLRAGPLALLAALIVPTTAFAGSVELQSSNRREARPCHSDGDALGGRGSNPGPVHAGRFRNARNRLLPRQERGNRRCQDPDQPLDRGHLLLGGGLCLRVRQRGRARDLRCAHRLERVLPAVRGEPGRGFPGHGTLGCFARGEVPVPVLVLRGLPGHRLGFHARADQVLRLRDLRDRLRVDHLPDRLPLGVRRWLASERRHAPDADRHAGLRRLHGGPPHRCDRRSGGVAAARPA